MLIDFQLAVSKTNYIELEYLTHRPNRLRKLGHKKISVSPVYLRRCILTGASIGIYRPREILCHAL